MSAWLATVDVSKCVLTLMAVLGAPVAQDTHWRITCSTALVSTSYTCITDIASKEALKCLTLNFLNL